MRDRVSVTCVQTGPPRPPLSLGMCLAYARQELPESRFDVEPCFVRTEDALRRALERSSRNVVLFSNYIWNVDANLAFSATAKSMDPTCLTVHGGPSTPAYAQACETFLLDEPSVDFAVRGEGEKTFVDLLEAIERGDDPSVEVPGVTALVRGIAVRGPDRPRSSTLDRFPSPYLTGVFDGLDVENWESATLETNRGCPYGCTFCDWGSATLQKLRRFDLERVRAELRWLAERRVPELWLADANFGILPRDLDIAEMICGIHRETGFPQRIVVNYAKNTHRDLVKIVELFAEEGLVSTGIVSLQTRDAETLKTVRRTNIRPREYDKLRDVFQRKGLPLTTQLMVGLPGSDVESLKADLRAEFAGPVDVQLFRTVALPNSPMSDPDYIAEHALEFDDGGLVSASSTFGAEEMAELSLLARLFRAAHTYGIGRYLLHFLHWEHELDPLDLLQALARDLVRGGVTGNRMQGLLDPDANGIDLLTTHLALRESLRSEASWRDFYTDFAAWACSRFGVASGEELDSLLDAQTAVMPSLGRSFPDFVELRHDVAGWFSARLNGDERPLSSFGPSRLMVADPWGLSAETLRPRAGIPATAWELESDLRGTRFEARPVAAQG